MEKVFTHDCCGPIRNGFNIFNGTTGEYVGFATGCEDIVSINKAISRLADATIIVTLEEVQQAIYRHEKYHLPKEHPVHQLPHLRY